MIDQSLISTRIPLKRPATDAAFAVIFLVPMAAAFIMQCMFGHNGIKFLSWVNCMGDIQIPDIITLTKEQVAGVIEQAGASVMAVALTFSLILCVAWISMLRKCAKVIVWGTYAIGLLATMVLIFYVKGQTNADFSDGIVWIPMAIWLMCVLTLYWRRENINHAARVISAACTAMGDNPSLFVVGFGLQLLQLAYISFFIFSVVMGYLAYSITQDSSDYENPYGKEECGFIDLDLLTRSVSGLTPPQGFVANGVYFVQIMFCWGLLFGDTLRLYICSGVMSVWYFGAGFSASSLSSDAPGADTPQASGSALHPRFSSLTFLKLGITKQLGTLAVAAAFTGAVQKLKQWAKAGWCKATIMWWLLIAKIICLCFAKILEAIGRFNVSISAMNGTAFCPSMKRSIAIIRSQFGRAIATETTASVVLNFGVLIFSMAVGTAAWMQTSIQLGYDPLALKPICEEDGTFCDIINGVIRGILFGFSGWVCYNVILGMFLLFLFPIIWTETVGVPVYIGVMCMLVSKLIFVYMGGLIKDSTTGIFVANAIDNLNGTRSDKAYLLESMQDMAAKTAPVTTTIVTTTSAAPHQQPVMAQPVYGQPPVAGYVPPISMTPDQRQQQLWQQQQQQPQQQQWNQQQQQQNQQWQQQQQPQQWQQPPQQQQPPPNYSSAANTTGKQV